MIKDPFWKIQPAFCILYRRLGNMASSFSLKRITFKIQELLVARIKAELECRLVWMLQFNAYVCLCMPRPCPMPINAQNAFYVPTYYYHGEWPINNDIHSHFTLCLSSDIIQFRTFKKRVQIQQQSHVCTMRVTTA